MLKAKIYFIYHRLQLEENLGLIARVLKNCNFSNIRLSQAKFEIPNKKAQMSSRGAGNLINNIESYNNFYDATLDLTHLYVTSKRQRAIQNIIISAEKASTEIAQLLKIQNINNNINTESSKQYKNQIKIGIAFGCEASGLTNQEIAIANKQICFSLNSDFASLNISHATAILAYLINMHIQALDNQQEISNQEIEKNLSLATKKEINNLLVKLIESLDNKNYYKTKELKPKMILNLTNLVYRSKLSSSEVQSLQNVLKFLNKT